MPNRRHRRCALGAGVITLAALIPAGFAVASSKTQGAVSTLAAAESKVVGVLKGYRDTSGWKAQFHAAEAAQAAALAKVETDLSPPKPAPPGGGSSSATKAFTDQNGVKYTVTLVRFIDPASPATQFDDPDPGTRLVGTLFTITDTGKGGTSDDANNDATLVGSNHQSYQSALNSLAGCTNFNSGQYQLNPGQSTTGCVSFDVPKAVKVTDVEWSPSSGFGGSFGDWKV